MSDTTQRYFLIAWGFCLLTIPLFGANDKNYTYLALGDSVPYGMNETLFPPFAPMTPLPTPSQFTGYPEYLAAALHLTLSNKEVNASCPGETSGSFLNINAPDYGCNHPHPNPPFPDYPPIKTTVGLHTPYAVSQMDFAVSQLKANKFINLVTLSIGANDVLLALLACNGGPTCGADVGTALFDYGTNLTTILTKIRQNYNGTLVLLTYYSPAAPLDGLTVMLNAAMTGVAAGVSAMPGFAPITVADGFLAFQLASLPSLDACAAGLLIPFPQGAPVPCDIHPSAKGQSILAATIQAAIAKH